MSDHVADAGKATETSKTAPEGATALSTGPTRDDVLADLKKFTGRFGADNGAKWFTDGKTYEQGLELHCDALTAEVRRLTAELEAANTKLANAPKGEATALSTSDAEKPAGTDKKDRQVSKTEAFGRKLKIPGQS